MWYDSTVHTCSYLVPEDYRSTRSTFYYVSYMSTVYILLGVDDTCQVSSGEVYVFDCRIFWQDRCLGTGTPR